MLPVMRGCPLAAAAKPCLEAALAHHATTTAALRQLNEQRIVMVTAAKQLSPMGLMFRDRPLTKRQHDRRHRAEAALAALLLQHSALSKELLSHSQELAELIRQRTVRRGQEYCFMLRGLFNFFLFRRMVLSMLLLRRHKILPRDQPRFIAAFGRALEHELSWRQPALLSLDLATHGAEVMAHEWLRAHVEAVIAAAARAAQLQEAMPSPPASPSKEMDTSSHFRPPSPSLHPVSPPSSLLASRRRSSQAAFTGQHEMGSTPPSSESVPPRSLPQQPQRPVPPPEAPLQLQPLTLPTPRRFLRTTTRRAAPVSPPRSGPVAVAVAAGVEAMSFEDEAREAVLGTTGEMWRSISPARLPGKYKGLVRVDRREGDVRDVPITRLDAFFPAAEHTAITECVLDPSTRVRWDKNYGAFRMLDKDMNPDEDGVGKVLFGKHTMSHRVESPLLRYLGFSPREFVYERVTERCGEKCVLAKFKSVEGPVPDSSDAVRARIVYQEVRIEEQTEREWNGSTEEGPLGVRLTMTSCVETDPRPPDSVIDFTCKMLSSQPYVWIREHLGMI
eukprot:Hpha_TRINITY_DN23373_c0_g1::TRINITY_DN23373_c0_g1_i1::g.97006::m.97006